PPPLLSWTFWQVPCAVSSSHPMRTQEIGKSWKRNMSNPLIPTSNSERIRPGYWFLFAVVGACAAAAIAFGGINFLRTRDLRQMAAAPNSELEWLRHEFHLSDAQFKQIADLQSAYAPV